MIHIEVDYQGGRSIETYSFTSTGDDYKAKLDEIEKYPGKIDSLKVFIGRDKVSTGWDEHPAKILVNASHLGIAIRRARKIKYPS